jgi:ubiquinone/menaquinone biosynthesis C-methylase UbiE
MDGQEFFSKASLTYYDETFEDLKTLVSLARAARTARVIQTLERLLKQPSIVADLGCGPAQLAAPLAALGHKYIGMDINPTMYASTAQRMPANRQIRFLEGSVEEIPLEDSTIDAAPCVGVFEYLTDRVRALREIFRVLKPDGIAIITIPSLRNPMHFVRQTVRPVAAPILRALIPQLRSTVYASGTYNIIMFPGKLCREAGSVGLQRLEGFSDCYYPLLFNHRLLGVEKTFYAWSDKIGETVLPGLGANYYLCLQKRR